MDTASATNDELVRHVESARDLYERMITIASGRGDEADRAWLADETGQDIDPSDEIARTWIDENVLELVGTWEGQSRDEADYKGCRVVVCTGGPHVELRTAARGWCGYWGSETVTRSASSDVCDYFDEWLS
jgi:hypothetical protein